MLSEAFVCVGSLLIGAFGTNMQIQRESSCYKNDVFIFTLEVFSPASALHTPCFPFLD